MLAPLTTHPTLMGQSEWPPVDRPCGKALSAASLNPSSPHLASLSTPRPRLTAMALPASHASTCRETPPRSHRRTRPLAPLALPYLSTTPPLTPALMRTTSSVPSASRGYIPCLPRPRPTQCSEIKPNGDQSTDHAPRPSHLLTTAPPGQPFDAPSSQSVTPCSNSATTPRRTRPLAASPHPTSMPSRPIHPRSCAPPRQPYRRAAATPLPACPHPTPHS